MTIQRPVSDKVQIEMLQMYVTKYSEKIKKLEMQVFIWRTAATILAGMVFASIVRVVMGW